MATAEQQEILDAIAAAAVDLLVLMPETAQVVRSTFEPDGYGGQTSTESVIAEVPCRRRALTGQDLATAAKLAPNATYRVTVPVGTDVTPTDALLVAGVRHEVVWVPANTFAAQLSCLCTVGA